MKYIYIVLTVVFFYSNQTFGQDKRYTLYAFGDPEYLFVECDNCIGFDCSGCDEDDAGNSSSLTVYDINNNILGSNTGTTSVLFRGVYDDDNKPYKVVYKYSTSSLGSGTYTIIIDPNNNDACNLNNSHPEEDYGLAVNLYEVSDLLGDPARINYCNEEEIEFKANKNCSNIATYSWSSSTNALGPFTSTGVTTSESQEGTIALSEILPNENYTGNLYVRASVSFNGTPGNSTDTVIYTIESCSPQLLDFNEKNATCSNSNDAGFDMILDRAIGPGKKLVVSLFFENEFIAGDYGLVEQFDAKDAEVPEIGTTGEYSYTWPEDISPGTYKVRYQTFDETTANPDWDSLEGTEEGFTIVKPTAVTLGGATGSDVHCKGGSDGEIILTGYTSGVSGSFSYKIWKQGSSESTSWLSLNSTGIITSFNGSGISAGTYNMKVRDSNGCVAVDPTTNNDKTVSVTIGEPTSVVSLTEVAGSKENVDEFGAANGSIVLQVTGGTLNNLGLANLSLSGTGMTNYDSATKRYTLSGLDEGSYTATINDSNYGNSAVSSRAGCTSSVSFSISEPPLLTVSISGSNFIQCNGESVTLSSSVGGGVEPSGGYGYQWKRGTSAVGAVSALVVTEPGSYTLEVTDDNNIKRTSTAILVTEASAVNFTANFGSAVTCYGGNNGSINLTGSGGSGSYEYVVSTSSFGGTPATGWIAFTGGASHTIEGRSSGRHYIQVRDSNGCTGKSGISTEEDVFIGGPSSVLEVSLLEQIPTSEATALDGSINISRSGGTIGYSYEWVKSGVNGIYSNSQNLTGLGVGDYTVTVRDGNYVEGIVNPAGCSVTATYTVLPTSPLVISTIDKKDINCNGGSDGILSVLGNVSGGTPTYNYQWYELIGASYSLLSGEDEATLEGRSSGSYQVIVTDGRGVTTELTETLINPIRVDFTATEGTFDCDNTTHTLNVLASEGSGTYEYEFNEDGNWTALPTNGNIAISDGLQRLRIRDTNECLALNNDGTIKEVPFNFSKINELTVSEVIVAPKGFGLEGTITLNVTEGTGVYKYVWYKVEGTLETELPGYEEELIAEDGTYKVIITDDNCLLEQTYTLTAPELLTVSIVETAPIACNGGTTSLTAVGNGGTPDTNDEYTYTWYSAVDSVVNTNDDSEIGIGKTLEVGAGFYYVKVEDSNNIIGYSNITPNSNFELKEPDTVVFEVTKTDVSCKGGDNGTITINATGGSGVYEYAYIQGSFAATSQLTWIPFANGLSTTISNTGMTAGSYEVQVRDTKECIGYNEIATGSIIGEIIIGEPVEALAFTVTSGTITTVSETGEDDGAVSISVSGGTGSYTYELYQGTLQETITTNVTTYEFDELLAGDYTVEVKDANYNNAGTANAGCFITTSFTIGTNLTLEITDDNTTVTDVSCYNSSDGSISVIATGGDENYVSYNWIKPNGDVATGSSINGLSASGDYAVTVTDGRGVSTTKTINLYVPSNTTFEASEGNAVYCKGGQDGSILLSNVTQDARVTGLSYELYKLNNSLRELQETVSFTPDTSNNYVISGLSTGTYYVKVKVDGLQGGIECYALNDDGSEKEEEVFINEPLEAVSYTFGTSVNPKAYLADDGSITINVSGGTPFTTGNPYEITWTGVTKDGIAITNGSLSFLTSNTAVLENLVDGTYSFTIRDSSYINSSGDSTSGCIINTSTITLEEPAELIVDISIEKNIICYGDNDMVLKANAEGGVEEPLGGYSYEWFEVASLTTAPEDGTPLGRTTQTIDTISSGIYIVKITDGNGITAFSEKVDLTGPDEIIIAPILATDITPLKCYGVDEGEVSVSVLGGTGDYTYIWEYTPPESINTITKETSTGNRIGLGPGTYKVTVKDEVNCMSSNSQTFTIAPLPEFDIKVSLMPPGEGLSDGSIAITEVLGGIAPYTYQWYLEDENSVFQEITGRTSLKEEGLPIGEYAVIVTDAIGCTHREQYTLNIPGELIVSVTESQAISCYGETGAVEVAVNGGLGTDAYSFQWYNTLDDSPIIGADKSVLSNQLAGSYYVVVSFGEEIKEQSRPFTLEQPEAVTLVSSSSIDLSCFESNDGSISLEAIGGTGSYSYIINKDGLGYSTWIDFTGGVKTTIEGLEAGSYDIQIQDNEGCGYNETGTFNKEVITIDIIEPTLLIIKDDYIVTPVRGFGLSNGAITINVEGGPEPNEYTYEWVNENNEIQNSITNTLEGIPAGMYTVSITAKSREDENGAFLYCTTSGTYTVTEPDLLEVAISQEAFIQCNGEAAADLRANATGGIDDQPYEYTWYDAIGNEIGDTQNLFNQRAGTYTVTVVDVNDNEVTSEITVIEPDVLATTIESSYTGCGTGNDWALEILAIGGTAPYTYSWSNGATTPTIADVTAGTYFVVIEDSNGCTITENHTITPLPALEVTATIGKLYCASACSGEIDIAITGGIAPYTILWSMGATDTKVTELCSGEYSVTISDAKGCEITQEYTIENPLEIAVDLGEDKTLCIGQNYELDIRISDDNATYNWESDNGFTSTEAKVSLTEAGIYMASVTTGLGCVGTDTIEIITSVAGVNAEFLITSQAFAEEEVIIINTSNPASDNIEWIFPEAVEVVETNETETITLRFDEPGAYEITLRSIEGNCFEDYTKTVIVEHARELPGIEDTEGSFISDFSMFPNPNNGVFTVSVDLGAEATVSLRLFSLLSNVPLDEREISGNSTYESDYNMSLSAGIYFLLLETAKESQIRKIVIE